MSDCIFCKIIKGDIPCHKVFENDKVLAFLDVNPLNEGHTLVVPKGHYETIFDMNEELSGEIMQVVWKISNVLKKQLEPDGLNLLQNNGAPAGQAVPHFHFHIIPRFANDDLNVGKWVMVPGDQSRLTKMREQLAPFL